MTKLLFLPIFTCLFALASEQGQAMLSINDTAQLLANFAKLPNELKQQTLPEYSPELNALVYLKEVYPELKSFLDKNKNIVHGGTRCGETFFRHNNKEHLAYRSWPCFLNNQPAYYPPIPLGPNKNNFFVMKGYVFDYSTNLSFINASDCKAHEGRQCARVAPHAVYVKNGFLHKQNLMCVHPAKNIMVGLDVITKHLMSEKTNDPRLTVTRYDSLTKKFDVESFSIPTSYDYLAYDTCDVDSEALWAIDVNQKLVKLNKINDEYVVQDMHIKDVTSIEQNNKNPELILVNGDSLYQITDSKTLKLIRKFENKARFLQPKNHLAKSNVKIAKFDGQNTPATYAIIIKPLTAVNEFLNQRSVESLRAPKALVDKMPKLFATKTNLKQRILQSSQSNNDKNMGGM